MMDAKRVGGVGRKGREECWLRALVFISAKGYSNGLTSWGSRRLRPRHEAQIPICADQIGGLEVEAQERCSMTVVVVVEVGTA